MESVLIPMCHNTAIICLHICIALAYTYYNLLQVDSLKPKRILNYHNLYNLD